MSEQRITLIMKFLMALMLGYFAYYKGWVFSDFKNISPQEAHLLLEKPNKILLLDVRSKKEFEKDHLEGARSVPFALIGTTEFRDSEILVYSERGELSVEASRILSKRGYGDVYNLEGGVVFWIRAGYKVIKLKLTNSVK